MKIETLNNTVKCRLAPSPIHGVGVFAIRAIKKGEKLYCVEEKKIWYKLKPMEFSLLRKEVKELILQRYIRALDGSRFLSPNCDARLMSFMNHSENDNYDIKTDTAKRDIKRGEEVTENYEEL